MGILRNEDSKGLLGFVCEEKIPPRFNCNLRSQVDHDHGRLTRKKSRFFSSYRPRFQPRSERRTKLMCHSSLSVAQPVLSCQQISYADDRRKAQRLHRNRDSRSRTRPLPMSFRTKRSGVRNLALSVVGAAQSPRSWANAKHCAGRDFSLRRASLEMTRPESLTHDEPTTHEPPGRR